MSIDKAKLPGTGPHDDNAYTYDDGNAGICEVVVRIIRIAESTIADCSDCSLIEYFRGTLCKARA